MFQRILIATDLSPVSRPALRCGLALAAGQKADVLLLHVNEKHYASEHWLVPPFEEELQPYRASIEREMEASRQRLHQDAAEALAGLGDVAHDRPVIEVLLRSGRAAETIAAVADEMKSHLVVVGTRGRRGTLGSVAEHVVREAPCPILIVPADAVL